MRNLHVKDIYSQCYITGRERYRLSTAIGPRRGQLKYRSVK
jgi:hypothetical protein